MLSLHKRKFRQFLAAVPDFKARLTRMSEMRKEQAQNTVKISNAKEDFDPVKETNETGEGARASSRKPVEDSIIKSLVAGKLAEMAAGKDSFSARFSGAARVSRAAGCLSLGGTTPSRRTEDYH